MTGVEFVSNLLSSLEESLQKASFPTNGGAGAVADATVAASVTAAAAAAA
eukprot:CAMPEP_0206611264 /NCGR_PEP_ID=MMETSP0325_2-20121206/55137_1 /ASSEMBLY_ACC=CAM_ASM_000347 /TAXON_ID=2866 /ORGANISM="Crypthecodinium cohnii, Strain Seligo" /LENGTH=49 /DNA_ID= /DNA_START= /DNA_END= /DNA_ORIENTATION=